MGCSTGNLLRHLAGGGLELHGADLVAEIIEANRADPALAEAEFHVQDMLDLKFGRTFDIVVVNAALMFFTAAELRTALAQLASILAPGGHLIGFDYVHPFEQELEIVETSAAFPAGLRLFMRSERAMREAMVAAGLEPVSFAPFEIPVELPRPRTPRTSRPGLRRRACPSAAACSSPGATSRPGRSGVLRPLHPARNPPRPRVRCRRRLLGVPLALAGRPAGGLGGPPGAVRRARRGDPGGSARTGTASSR